jgi:hypothetical protein
MREFVTHALQPFTLLQVNAVFSPCSDNRWAERKINTIHHLLLQTNELRYIA